MSVRLWQQTFSKEVVSVFTKTPIGSQKGRKCSTVCRNMDKVKEKVDRYARVKTPLSQKEEFGGG